MPSLSIKSHFLVVVLIALPILTISSPGVAAEKAPWVGTTLKGKECWGARQGFGPYDYRMRARLPAELEVVERAHFTPEVERLERGASAPPIQDIAYTIMAWPNHHRALHSAMRYRMMVWEWPDDAPAPPAECQLQRAMAFSPDDPVPYMMYGMLLHKAQQYDKALLVYREAIRLRPDDALTLYNMGLTLVELKQYQEAVKMAKAAYAAGIPVPGLKNKLIAAGQWPADGKTAAVPKAAPEVKLQTPEKAAKNAAQKEKAPETKP